MSSELLFDLLSKTSLTELTTSRATTFSLLSLFHNRPSSTPPTIITAAAAAIHFFSGVTFALRPAGRADSICCHNPSGAGVSWFSSLSLSLDVQSSCFIYRFCFIYSLISRARIFFALSNCDAEELTPIPSLWAISLCPMRSITNMLNTVL